MQCLYCETELKPFRGLFDEDFCCREHRDKYLSSFRKALSRLPDILGTSEAENSVPQITLLIDGPVSSAAFDDLSTEIVEAPALEAVASPVAGEPLPAEVAGSAASVPRMADFLQVAIVPAAASGLFRSAAAEMFSACRAIEVPLSQAIWNAALEAEQRPAELIDSVQFNRVAALAPINILLSAPGLPRAVEMQSAAVSLETAGPAGSDENHTASGYNSPWTYADLMVREAAALAVPTLDAGDGITALAPIEEHAEITLRCQQIESEPVLACEIALAHETHLPTFVAPRDSMHADGEYADTGDPGVYWGELYSDQTPVRAAEFLPGPEIAPALPMSSIPVDRPALLPACSAEMMPANFEISASQGIEAPPKFVVPELSFMNEAQPGLASIAQGEVAKSAAGPRSHEPLKPSFGSSVRIKNWRLRITFAKPA